MVLYNLSSPKLLSSVSSVSAVPLRSCSIGRCSLRRGSTVGKCGVELSLAGHVHFHNSAPHRFLVLARNVNYIDALLMMRLPKLFLSVIHSRGLLPLVATSLARLHSVTECRLANRTSTDFGRFSLCGSLSPRLQLLPPDSLQT